MPQTNDRFYRELFSDKQTVRDLLEGYVPHPWVREVDFAQMELLKDIHIFEGSRRDSDVIWKLKVGNSTVLVVLMLEFQSNIDKTMPLRMALYQCLFYQLWLKNHPDDLLPQMLPMVIYNGDDLWTAKTQLIDLIENGFDALKPYQIQSRYWPIEMNQLAQQNLPLHNLVTSVIELETMRSRDRMEQFFAHLPALLEQPDNQHLRRLFIHALRRMLKKRPKLGGALPDNLSSLTEAKAMIDTNMMQWEQNLRAEGWQRGSEEGWQRGSEATQRSTLRRLLKKKFGALPAWIEQKIEAAPAEIVEGWLDEVVVAPSLNEIFGHC
jgi:predicted transposase/invertase (TIGR01784 family)